MPLFCMHKRAIYRIKCHERSTLHAYAPLLATKAKMYQHYVRFGPYYSSSTWQNRIQSSTKRSLIFNPRILRASPQSSMISDPSSALVFFSGCTRDVYLSPVQYANTCAVITEVLRSKAFSMLHWSAVRVCPFRHTFMS